ncbi:hypothetical protein [Caulobacter sp. 17J65-9]|uniref:hypothetical protein n=1 Tax=Caulobacter sp. 17J65-9 TaxID=2709382 RepID=UPI0013C9C9AE|nr:hypothetical protein [Caulobacter sp. 17J65-9]NEX93019.1 hypothetical protein [Caulobacter sp. 17J65-9]
MSHVAMEAHARPASLFLALSLCATVLGGCEAEPGRIETSADHKLNAYWTLKLSGDGIATRGDGGACLLQSRTDFLPEISCVRDDQCDVYETLGHAKVKTQSGYCNRTEHTCWVKPIDDSGVCDRNGAGPPWSLGEHKVNPQPVDLTQHPSETHWRILTCLNGVTRANENDFKCKVNAGTYRWGDPTTVLTGLPDAPSKAGDRTVAPAPLPPP